MEKKMQDMRQRAKLLKTFYEKKISQNTQEKISQTFIQLEYEQMEIHAQKMLEIINSSKSEEEILTKIRNI